MSTTQQQGASAQTSSQQQGQAPAGQSQQSAGTATAPKSVFRDWAAI